MDKAFIIAIVIMKDGERLYPRGECLIQSDHLILTLMNQRFTAASSDKGESILA